MLPRPDVVTRDCVTITFERCSNLNDGDAVIGINRHDIKYTGFGSVSFSLGSRISSLPRPYRVTRQQSKQGPDSPLSLASFVYTIASTMP
jgi:hypothetical protein